MTVARQLLRSALDPWVGFFALVLAAWFLLFSASVSTGHAGAAAIGTATGWTAALMAGIGGHGPSLEPGGQAGLTATVAMWCLMSVAMMAPTAVPMLRAYRHLVAGSAGRVPAAGFWALLAGYLAVWALFSFGAGAAQHVLGSAALLDGSGVSATPWLTSALLAVAGAYQLSRLKQACLSRCRSPLAFFLSHWRAGGRGALSMGLRHGAVCVGCCWALMALAFVGGTMNLAWMGIATVLMVVEKLPIGRWLTTPIGAVLLVAAALTGLRALPPL